VRGRPGGPTRRPLARFRHTRACYPNRSRRRS